MPWLTAERSCSGDEGGIAQVDLGRQPDEGGAYRERARAVSSVLLVRFLGHG